MTPRDDDGRRLRDYRVLPAYAFHVYHGPTIDSIPSLIDFLHIISDEQLDHHVGHGRNDFAQWMEGVFGRGDLAREMRSAKDRGSMVSLLQKDIFGFEEIGSLDDASWVPAAGWGTPDQNAESLSATLKGRDRDGSAVKITAPAKKPALAGKAPSELDDALDAVDPKDEASFDRVKRSIIERNERLDEKYDDVVRRMQEVLHDPVPKDVESELERLKGEYDELRARVSEARKLGKDALVPALILKQFPPKLQLARITRSMDDIAKAEIILKQAAFEIAEAKDVQEVDVRREVYALAGLDENGKPPSETAQGGASDGR